MRRNVDRLFVVAAICLGFQAHAQENKVAASLNAEQLAVATLSKVVQLTSQAVEAGSGTRDLYVFSDPLCSHCRNFAIQLAQIPNLRVHTYLLPRLRGAAELGEALWCAQDRNLAWEAFTQVDMQPLAATCDHPFLENARLAAEVGVTLTPTFVTSDGRKYTGFRSKQAMEKILDSSTYPSSTLKRKRVQ